MFNFGLFELTLFGVIALIVLGPEELPKFARTLGKWYGLFRRTSARLQSELISELELVEAQELLKGEIAKIRESEQAMKAQMQELQLALAKTQRTATASKDSIMNAWQQDDTAAQSEQADAPDPSEPATVAMHYHWFMLGEYDRRRRLPPPPFLPNYVADDYLYHQS